MRLNPDCIRAVLLTVEEFSTFSNFIIYDKNESDYELLKEYSHEEILYHIKQCSQSNLLQGVTFYDDGGYVAIGDLTPEGHTFIENLRNDTVFNKTKQIVASTGISSIKAMGQIGTAIATELIKGAIMNL